MSFKQYLVEEAERAPLEAAIIDKMLAKFKSWAEDEHSSIQDFWDNGVLEDTLAEVIRQETKGAFDKDIKAMDKKLHNMSWRPWEKLFTAKFGKSSEALAKEADTKEVSKLPENMRKFLADIGGGMTSTTTPTDIKKGAAELSYFMKSPTKMTIRIWAMNDRVYSDEALAKFGLTFDKVEKFFTSLGVKMGKRPIYKRGFNSSLYD